MAQDNHVLSTASSPEAGHILPTVLQTSLAAGKLCYGLQILNPLNLVAFTVKETAVLHLYGEEVR